MKIYLDDGFALEHQGGIGTYFQILVEELRKRNHQVVTPAHRFIADVPGRPLRRLLYSLHLLLILPWYLRANRFDVAHFTNLQAPILRNGRTRYVTTVHDISPILFPETVPCVYRAYFKWALKVAIANCDTIVTVSESVKQELAEVLDVPSTKIKVCYNNLRPIFRRGRAEDNGVLKRFALQPKAYFLYVGRLERRKNVVTLIRGFEAFKQASGSLKKLVLVGSHGFGFSEIEQTRSDCFCKDDIVITDFVTDDELTALYSGSVAVVFPSLYEGFGLPLFEAMSFRLPVIASRIPTSLEILDSRAFFFERRSVTELQSRFEDVESFGSKYVDYSDILQKYTLDKMIDRHLEAYKQCGSYT